LFCDDYYHPGIISSKGLAPVVEELRRELPILAGRERIRYDKIEIDEISDASNFDPLMLGNYAVIVMSKCDHVSQTNNAPWKTQEIQNAFVKYVESGGGLLVTHSGIVAGENNSTDALDKLIGCRFVSHPNNCPVTVGVLKPHPITLGVEIFCETDEHYHIEVLADDIDILAASFSDAQGDESKFETEPYFNAPAYIAPAAYVRKQGKGKVCVLTPGHTLDTWLNKQFAKLLRNAVRWLV
jgi:type 1 glutamine amidotransferase